MTFEDGQRLHIPSKNLPEWVTVDHSVQTDDGWKLYVADDTGTVHKVTLTQAEATGVSTLSNDGAAPSPRVLAGMWTRWMAAAATNAKATLLASTPLRPYVHQSNAVYGAMLPQPRLRFLLADEPGTGKTIMAGMTLREMQKLGVVRRALVVAPAGLVSKWQDDFQRFFGGELRRITADTVEQHALDVTHDMWIVSLELAAVNANVQDAIRPDRAGWDIVVLDEAHRLTPTAQTYHRVGRLLGTGTPRALLMTATPHRGSEWLFRHLLHIVDHDIYPDPGDDPKAELQALTPGGIHFLRRMKEDLLDYDGTTRLFKGRRATNFGIPLSSVEDAIYRAALDLVDAFFPQVAQPLARMVYGKRAASSLFALAETLRRRRDGMGTMSPAEAEREADPYGEDDAAGDEAKVIAAESTSSRAEKKAIATLLDQIDALLKDPSYVPSKWARLTESCLTAQGIAPGNDEQAVIFTEYADTAEWITRRLADSGYTPQMYSGRQSHEIRDVVRAAFMRGEFQIIVSTDAGNEGIDLQSAHVLVNYDIPWSLVRLEQRMGRIHRVGQDRNVELFNLVATGTREGDALHTLLENFVIAANDLDGQMFDSLSLVAEMTGVRYEEWLSALYGDDDLKKQEAINAVKKVQSEDLKRAAQKAHAQEADLAARVDVVAALTLLQQDLLERVNPAIVESYLTRLADAGVLRAQPTAAGAGILQLSHSASLPASLGGRKSALVATSGDALREAAKNADTSRVIALGPGEPAFTDLIRLADDTLGPDVYRGGAAQDPTSVTGYDLYAYEATLSEASGRRDSAWAALIRVDDTGEGRHIRWEALANLVPSNEIAGPLHPGRTHEATVTAKQIAQDSQARYQTGRGDWFGSAKHELQALPTNLTKKIADRQERLAARARIAAQVEARLAGLQAMSQVTITEPRLVAHLRIKATGAPATVQEKDSERVAMTHIRDHMRDQGWRVTDVSTEGRGYDMHAVRGSQQRCVEVKGVWQSAAAHGIRMTGNEVLIATQHRHEYWLYVVDNCHDGRGTLFGSYPDPVGTFRADIKSEAIFRVPGSSLKAARDQEQAP